MGFVVDTALEVEKIFAVEDRGFEVDLDGDEANLVEAEVVTPFVVGFKEDGVVLTELVTALVVVLTEDEAALVVDLDDEEVAPFVVVATDLVEVLADVVRTLVVDFADEVVV